MKINFLFTYKSILERNNRVPRLVDPLWFRPSTGVQCVKGRVLMMHRDLQLQTPWRKAKGTTDEKVVSHSRASAPDSIEQNVGEGPKVAAFCLDSNIHIPVNSLTLTLTWFRPQDGVELFVVSVGKGVSDAAARGIASPPRDAHVLTAHSFAQLPELVSQLKERIDDLCNGERFICAFALQLGLYVRRPCVFDPREVL